MRTRLKGSALLLVAGILFLGACSQDQKFAILDGEPVAILSDKRTVFINYWAVWCAPCLEEMPILAAFREQHSDIAEVYAVNYDNPTSEQLREDVSKLNVRLPSLLEDPAQALGAERPQVLPTTLVVKDGLIVQVLIGPQTTESLFKAL